MGWLRVIAALGWAAFLIVGAWWQDFRAREAIEDRFWASFRDSRLEGPL